jgi:hypothetical protein
MDRMSFSVVPPVGGSALGADSALVPPSNALVAEAGRSSEAAVAFSSLSELVSPPAFPAAGGLISFIPAASSLVAFPFLAYASSLALPADSGASVPPFGVAPPSMIAVLPALSAVGSQAPPVPMASSFAAVFHSPGFVPSGLPAIGTQAMPLSASPFVPTAPSPPLVVLAAPSADDLKAASRVTAASSVTASSLPFVGVSSGFLANSSHTFCSIGASSVATAYFPLSTMSWAMSGSTQNPIVLMSPTIPPPTTPGHTVAIVGTPGPLVATPFQAQQLGTERGPISNRPLPCSHSRSFPRGGLFLPELQPPPSAMTSTAAAGQVAPRRQQQEALSEKDSNDSDVDLSKSNPSDGTECCGASSASSFDSSEPSLSPPVPGRACSTLIPYCCALFASEKRLLIPSTSLAAVPRAVARSPQQPAAAQPRRRCFKQPCPCSHQTSSPPLHSISPAVVRADSSPVPVAPAVASSSARCQPTTCKSRCPRDAWYWLHAALVIVMLNSMCCISVAQGTWSTARLNLARKDLAATSVGNVAIFAGGFTGNLSFALCIEGLLLGLLLVGDV